jgi:hypothetical protein
VAQEIAHWSRISMYPALKVVSKRVRIQNQYGSISSDICHWSLAATIPMCVEPGSTCSFSVYCS